jgi:DNA-3-methyladenine glycosylase I
MEPGLDGKKRCFGNKPGQELYAKYHDEEWGVPVHDDKTLFEFLILETAQAGLSWWTILQKREGYRNAFCDFDALKVSEMSDQSLEKLVTDPNVVRSRPKILSARQNAIVFLDIQKEFGLFDKYLWKFVNNETIVNRRIKSFSDLLTKTEESDKLAADLKKRGMKFIGSTTMYAFMQAVGLYNDHMVGCWRHIDAGK